MMKLHKWTFNFGFYPNVRRWGPNFVFSFGVFKIIDIPPPGEVIWKKYYKGFWFRKDININGFEINL